MVQTMNSSPKHGSTIPLINSLSVLKSLPIPIAPVAEQRLIAITWRPRRPHHPPARNQRHARSHRPGAVQVVVCRFRPRARQDGRPRPRRHGRGHRRAVSRCAGGVGVGVGAEGVAGGVAGYRHLNSIQNAKSKKTFRPHILIWQALRRADTVRMLLFRELWDRAPNFAMATPCWRALRLVLKTANRPLLIF